MPTIGSGHKQRPPTEQDKKDEIASVKMAHAKSKPVTVKKVKKQVDSVPKPSNRRSTSDGSMTKS
jgi:hypothetical protein